VCVSVVLWRVFSVDDIGQSVLRGRHRADRDDGVQFPRGSLPSVRYTGDVAQTSAQRRPPDQHAQQHQWTIRRHWTIQRRICRRWTSLSITAVDFRYIILFPILSALFCSLFIKLLTLGLYRPRSYLLLEYTQSIPKRTGSSLSNSKTKNKEFYHFWTL